MAEFDSNNSNSNNNITTKPKAKGHGWKIAVLVLSLVLVGSLALTAVAGGALLMKYLPGSKLGAALDNKTSSPITTIAPKVTTDPLVTLPPIGGKNTLALAQGIDIPKIVNADSPAVVGVLNMVKDPRSNSADLTLYGSGSGVIISTDGYIVTNNHVVEGADSVSVVLANGKKVNAVVKGADAQTDLAVLKIEETGLTAIPFGNSSNVQVGETVIAIGNPMGLDLTGTVTAGILSGKNREIAIDGYNFKVLQTDAAINPGNSGGALVDSKGQLIGINNAKDPAAEGIGFAIPINEAKPIIEQLMRGSIDRPIIGITSHEITQQEMDYYKVPIGVGIYSLADNGPAMKAGLRAGDIIVEMDGTQLKTITDLRDELNRHKVGDTVKVKVFRQNDNKELTVDVTLGSSAEMNK